jgi:hypothetical protein
MNNLTASNKKSVSELYDQLKQVHMVGYGGVGLRSNSQQSRDIQLELKLDEEEEEHLSSQPTEELTRSKGHNYGGYRLGNGNFRGY